MNFQKGKLLKTCVLGEMFDGEVEDIYTFNEGDEVLILHKCEDKNSISGESLVVFDPVTKESVTFDVKFVELIE